MAPLNSGMLLHVSTSIQLCLDLLGSKWPPVSDSDLLVSPSLSTSHAASALQAEDGQSF